MNRQAHALVERCIGRVQVIVPKFVARIVPVGAKSSTNVPRWPKLWLARSMSSRAVSTVYPVSRVTRKKPYLFRVNGSMAFPAKGRSHGCPSSWCRSNCCRRRPTRPILGQNSLYRSHLIHEGDALGRHEVIQFTQRAAVLEHLEEWIGKYVLNWFLLTVSPVGVPEALNRNTRPGRCFGPQQRPTRWCDSPRRGC